MQDQAPSGVMSPGASIWRRLWEPAMADSILIPVQSVGVLALTQEEFEAALAAGARLTSARRPQGEALSAESLLDAYQAAAQLGVSARWLEDSARAGIVPHYKLGRFIRFKVSEVATHCKIGGAPMPVAEFIGHEPPVERGGR